MLFFCNVGHSLKLTSLLQLCFMHRFYLVLLPCIVGKHLLPDWFGKFILAVSWIWFHLDFDHHWSLFLQVDSNCSNWLHYYKMSFFFPCNFNSRNSTIPLAFDFMFNSLNNFQLLRSLTWVDSRNQRKRSDHTAIKQLFVKESSRILWAICFSILR